MTLPAELDELLKEVRQIHGDVTRRRRNDDVRSWLTAVGTTVAALGLISTVGLLWNNSTKLSAIEVEVRHNNGSVVSLARRLEEHIASPHHAAD